MGRIIKELVITIIVPVVSLVIILVTGYYVLFFEEITSEGRISSLWEWCKYILG